jgi:ATP-binding cassette, subfamily B, bacterial
MATSRASQQTLSRRLLHQVRPYSSHIVCILLIDLVATPLSLLSPVPLKIVVDTVIGSQPLPPLLDALLPNSVIDSQLLLLSVATVLQVLIVFFNQLQTLGSYVLRTHTGERITLDFRARLFRHVQRLAFTFHDTRGTAESIYCIQYDAPGIQWLTLYGVIPLLTSGVTLLSMIYVTARLDWHLALVATSIIPLLMIIPEVYERRMRGQYVNVKELESSTLGIVQEVLSALRVVKAFGREEHEQERFVGLSSTGMGARIRLAFVESAVNLLSHVITAIGAALVLYLGVRSVLAGHLTLGELLMVITYLTQLYGPLNAISDKIISLQPSKASIQRAFALLDAVPDVTERPHARALKRAAGAIRFHGVGFAYDGRNLILDDISFAIEAGTRLGIAGKTGAGKSTLISLLMRFYDPSTGQILLDGVDIRDYKLADLRNQFAVVMQEPVLFSTSIAENIAYGRPGASFQEIVAAAKVANAHDFIADLPNAYDTRVGERGMMLSGGERQRIALARAFLKDAPILILDEPTSSIDVATEAMIMEAMERVMAGRTTVMIAHRLSTLEGCDARLVIEHGRIVNAEGRIAYAGLPRVDSCVGQVAK